MEKRIELEKRGRPAAQITELILDNCRSTNIVGLTDDYSNLVTLSLINVGLTTLKGFPKLPKLKKLELSDNRISNGLIALESSPNITTLNMSGNRLGDLDALKPLESFKHLEVLDLFNNEVTNIENYRSKVFELIPSLKYLDGFDSMDVEAMSDGEDDEETNGAVTNSDDDGDVSKGRFNINGLEIDLAELDAFERRVAEKRVQQRLASNESAVDVATVDESTVDKYDDLDEYLERLQLSEAPRSNSRSNGHPEPSLPPATVMEESKRPSFLQLLYLFMSILSLANIFYRLDNPPPSEQAIDGSSVDDEDDDDDDDDSSEDKDNGDVSLSEVYNDELEDDYSYWDGAEEDGEEEDDDDSSGSDVDDEKQGNEAAAAKPKAAAGTASKEEGGASGGAAGKGKSSDAPKAANDENDESDARGKKRKHDG